MVAKITKESIRTTLIEVFGKHALAGTRVAENSHITGDLGIDSLAVMEIIADLEDRFGLTFPDDELPKIRTVGDVSRAIEDRLGAEGRLG